jgi:hypothetical protein
MKANAQSHTHLQFAPATAATKNCKRVCLSPTLNDKRNEKKYDRTTMAIRNAGESADMKVITLNKLTAKRKVKCPEIPHYA